MQQVLAERTIRSAPDTLDQVGGQRRVASGRTVTVNLAESPLAWLRARGLVDARQFEAGERLRADYERALLSPSVTMHWGSAAGGKQRRAAPEMIDRTHAQIAAKARFDEAIERVGPGLRDVLWRVICAGEGLPVAERAMGWPARCGRVVLTIALDRLADAYGLR